MKRTARYNPHYPDRVPITYRQTKRPQRVFSSERTRPCAQCGRPFQTYRLVEHDDRTIQINNGLRITCSEACNIERSRVANIAIRAAAAGVDPDAVLTARAAASSRNRRSRLFADAYVSRLLDGYAAGALRYRQLSRFNLAAATIAACTLMTKPDLFNPHQASRLRARIYDIVEKHLDDVGKSLSTDPANTRHMTNAQVSLFKALLGKVLPDLNASFNVNESRRVPANQLSREELERLATGDPSLDIEVIEPPAVRPLAIKAQTPEAP